MPAVRQHLPAKRHEPLLSYLIKDGYLQIVPKLVPSVGMGAMFTNDHYRLTDRGRAFIEALIANKPLD